MLPAFPRLDEYENSPMVQKAIGEFFMPYSLSPNINIDIADTLALRIFLLEIPFSISLQPIGSVVKITHTLSGYG
jgi:hypothetical protein